MGTDLARTLRVEEFPSGEVYGYVLPDVGRMLYSGIFPAPVIPIMRASYDDVKAFGERELTDEEMQAWDEGRARIVAWMVRTKGGEVKDTPLLDEDGKAQIDLATMSVKVNHEVIDFGKPVELAWETVVDPEQFPTDDFLELYLRAVRSKPAPKATPTTGGRKR